MSEENDGLSLSQLEAASRYAPGSGGRLLSDAQHLPPAAAFGLRALGREKKFGKPFSCVALPQSAFSLEVKVWAVKCGCSCFDGSLHATPLTGVVMKTGGALATVTLLGVLSPRVIELGVAPPLDGQTRQAFCVSCYTAFGSALLCACVDCL